MRALLLLAVLLAASASAQTARPYVHAGAGGAVLPSLHDYGDRETVRKAWGWGGAVEAGLSRGPRSLGLRVEALRARRGEPADLQAILPTADWYDAYQVSALVVSRQRFGLGGLEVAAGSGAGVGYNVTVVQETQGLVQVRDGAVVSSLPTRREARVLPLLSLDFALGRTVGGTFVGVGASTSGVLGDDVSARYGIEVRREF